MSIFELFMVYAVSWWLILFMVLPWGVRMAAKPQAGHAASAPVNPNLRRKLAITSLLALLVPAGAYAVSEARAESGLYHASSNECAARADAGYDASVQATDSNATVGRSSTAGTGVVATYLGDYAADYTSDGQADRIGTGIVDVGIAQTDTRTGEVRINGTPVGSAAATRSPNCP